MKALRYLTILLAVALVQGCAKRAIVEQDHEVPAFDPDKGEEPTIPTSSSVLLVNDQGNPISERDLNGYLGNVPAYKYKSGSAKMSLGLTKMGSGYGGYIKISFIEDGQESVVYQQTKDPKSDNYSSKDVRHNIWFQKSGENYWHGFFQDAVGAVVVVIDGEERGGTGDNPHDLRLTGSVWYMNFNTHYPYNPMQGYKPCWEIPIGNFNCGTFFRELPRSEWGEHEKRNSVLRYYVDTTSSIYPKPVTFTDIVGGQNHGQMTIGRYTKLGNFKGLSRAEAFGN